MNVLPALVQVFELAKTQQADLYKTWVRLSHLVGSRLPASLLSVSIQRDGEIDLVLRCLEDEQAQRMAAGIEAGLFDMHYLNMLSTYWVGSMYETFRLLRQRRLSGTSPVFNKIFSDLELLRMPLEKHELAKDKETLKEPLQMVRQPQSNDATDHYSYDPKDNRRAHIMPSGLSSRGSMTWHVIDLKAGTDRWVERRALSERIVELWKDKQPQPAQATP